MLYRSQAAAGDAQKTALLLSGRDVLNQAQQVMDRRVANFRVPTERVAGWRAGPTVYPFGYIWSTKSLYVSIAWRSVVDAHRVTGISGGAIKESPKGNRL